jgi:hypothetical protein
MLTQVPQALRVAARAMVTRHRNAFDAQVFRRTVTRTAGAESGQGGGRPTLGGLAVMDPEDEAEVDYVPLGNAKVLFTGQYEDTTLSSRRDFAEQMATSTALIEPDTQGAFEPKNGDLVMLFPGGGVVVPYEVTGITATVNIPPYVPRYELSAQGDLMFADVVAQSQAGRP